MARRSQTFPLSIGASLLFGRKREPKPLKRGRAVQINLLGESPELKWMNGYYSFYSGAESKEAAKTFKRLASVGGRFDVKIVPTKRGYSVPYLIYRRKK